MAIPTSIFPLAPIAARLWGREGRGSKEIFLHLEKPDFQRNFKGSAPGEDLSTLPSPKRQAFPKSVSLIRPYGTAPPK